MPNKRKYRRIAVNKVQPEELRELAIERGDRGTSVGLDIAKDEIVAVIRWPDGSFEQPWKAVNPTQIPDLIERLALLREVCDDLTIGLESTGTYGDPGRYAMTNARLEVHQVRGKAVADYKEIFDGVPSQHDGKDAAMIAELTRFNKGTPWPYVAPTQAEAQMRCDVARNDLYTSEKLRWLSRAEAILARHWPELTSLIKLGTVTLEQLCIHYGSPARVIADDQAAANLRRWSRGRLTASKIGQILESARTTAGLPMTAADVTWLAEIAETAKRYRERCVEAEKSLKQQAEADAAMRPLVESVGAVSLCGIWVAVGDPANYDSSGAFVKALGLNLKELSSGKRKGQLAITKRGNPRARKSLYFWAMRGVQRPELKDWYAKFTRVGRSDESRNSEHRKMKGLIALMRRMASGLWHARKHGEAFDYAKLFPGRPLQAGSSRVGGRRRRVRQAN